MEDLRIYVASLSDYNSGVMLGRWIDLDGKDVEDVREEIAAMLRDSRFPNVTVECPMCEGRKTRPVASCVSPDRAPCPECSGAGVVPSAEEWAVHDYDGIPSSFGEYPDLDELIAYAGMLDEHGDAWRAYVELMGGDATPEGFEDALAGEASSELAWIEQFLDEVGTLEEMPVGLRHYFNYEAYLRDLTLGGDVAFVEVGGTVYAFWNR